MRSLVDLDLETSNGLMPAVGELMKLSRLLIIPGVKHAVQIIVVDLCLLVLESHNERTRNTLKHSTCSHKWWELKDRSLV